MHRDYDSEVATVESEIERLMPRLRDALGGWLDATAPWVAERWQETLETAIAYNPDAVKALGEEQRRTLKERTTAMIRTPRPHIEKRLVEDHPEAWPHLRNGARRNDYGEDFTTKTHHVGGKTVQSVPDGVSSMLNSVLSDMADLLEAEGFKLVRFIPGSPRSRSQRPRVAAGLSLEWSAAMMQTMDAYAQLAAAYGAALDACEKVQMQRARAEAEELWGST